jgi:p-cymene monooxygenase electron transfer component
MSSKMSFLKTWFGKAPARSVRVEPGGQRFMVAPGETVLERALKDSIAYPHDCTVGTCGSCRTKLLAGKVDAVTPFSYSLSREELQAGYILACQAVPKTDLVLEVEIPTGAAIAARTLSAKLVGLDDLTHDIKRARWEVDKPIDYLAGQYVNVRWDGGGEHRSYSFATAPESGGRTQLTTFIRYVPGGKFTELLFKGDPIGRNYKLDGPHGNFWLRDGTEPLICIAGGSGLAPLLSLLQDAARRKIRRDCILLFGARGVRDLYAADEIAAIRRDWAASFEHWPILSEERATGFRHGLVTEVILEAIAKLGTAPHGYMCGPPRMIDAGVQALVNQSIALDDIHYDKFTDASTRARTMPRS